MSPEAHHAQRPREDPLVLKRPSRMRAGTRGGLGPRDWETQRSLEQREVLTVFLFGEGESEQVEDWRAALERLADDQLLWLALRDPTEEDVTALQEELELGEENARRLLEQPSRASLADAGGRMHVTLYAASVEEGEPVLTSIECALGRNWIVTAHRGEPEVLEDFRERAEGGGQVVRSMPLPSSPRVSSGSSPATSAPSRLSRASLRSWTRGSCPAHRRTSPTT